MEHFGRIADHRPSSIPMQKIVAFALFPTRRQEEITLLRWDDLDGDRILVRDMKHPGDKKGNNVYCELPPEALAIIQSMPRAGERIFPYSTDAISAGSNPDRATRVAGSVPANMHMPMNPNNKPNSLRGWFIQMYGYIFLAASLRL